MAQELVDGAFWLPSDFLTDDDLLMDFQTDPSKPKAAAGWNSYLSSPVDSVMGSAETESDEDEFVAGLTRKLAHSNMLSDDESKVFKMSTSPQSTLWARKQGPLVSSPPPETKDAAGWHLPFEGGRSSTARDTTPFYSSNPNARPGFEAQSQAHLAYLRLQALQQQQLLLMKMKRGVSAQGKTEHHFPNLRSRGETAGRAQGLSMAAWPTLQRSQQKQKPGSGMRAVFLGETGSNNERTGTGVFLPQRFGSNPTETRKKPAYSTVLLPDRVIGALNLNLDAINAQARFRGNFQRQPPQGFGFSQDPTH